jgi:predicted metalloprotease
MQRPLIVLLSGLLGSLLLSGTAHAESAAKPVPTGRAALTNNPLYKTGGFDLTECKELSVQRDNLDEARLYLEHVLDCLNQSWGTEFKQAGLPFSKPRVQYITKRKRAACGLFPRGAQGLYCSQKRTMVILLDKDLVSHPEDLWLLNVISHEYGHHVQNISGVLDEEARISVRASEAKIYEITRRIELQAECFSGAFIGSIWHSLGRDDFDFQDLLDTKLGDREHGTTGNIRYWLKRGWKGEAPSYCNTFTVSRSRVA